jgi:thiol-disulfide isomerase/thioredoxin
MRWIQKIAAATFIVLIGSALVSWTMPGGLATSAISAAQAKQGAPELQGGGRWFNSAPLTLSQLRGKVVLVDFWTYGCVNCVNTLPHVTALYEKYKDKGLVVIGVHTPEFLFERSSGNVETALKRHGITYPVVQDNDSKIWNAYRNQYWPAQYVIDRDGQIVYTHAGEGSYQEMDRLVGQLLGAQG